MAPASNSIPKITISTLAGVLLAGGLVSALAGGSPLIFFGQTVGVPGVVEGPLNTVVVFGGVLIAALSARLLGERTDAGPNNPLTQIDVPFVLGALILVMLASKFLLPDVLTRPFAGIGEALFGVSQVSVVRWVVLLFAFIIVYYLALVRLQGAGSGAKAPVTVVNKATNRVQDLIDTYGRVAAVFVGFLVTATGIVLANAGRAVGTVAPQLAEVPVWTGYLATLVGGAANFAFGWTNLTADQFGIFALITLAIVAAVYFDAP